MTRPGEDFAAVRTRLENWLAISGASGRWVSHDVERTLAEVDRLTRRLDQMHAQAEAQARLARIAAVRRLCWTGEAYAIRHRARATLAELGAAVGVAPSVIQRWETGFQLPNDANALAYGAALDTLLTIAEPEPRKESR